MQWIPGFAVSFLSAYWPLIGLFLLGIFFWDYKVTYNVWKNQGIPGPTPIPFFGLNPIQVYNRGMPLYLKDCIMKYGKVCGIFIGRSPILLNAEPEFIKQVHIKEFGHFVNRVQNNHFRLQPAKLTKSVLLLRDQDWKRVRTTISPIFSMAKMKQMIPLINEGLDVLVYKLGDCADRGETVNMAEMYGRFTMETIFKSAFGINSQSQNDPNDQYTNAAKKIFMVNSFVLFMFTFFPFFQSIMMFFRRPFLTPVHFLNNTAKAMVTKRRQDGHPARTDLLKLMMEAETKSEDGTLVNKLTDKEIEGQCFTFLLAGYETTANALTFLSYVFTNYPDIQEKVLAEINQYLQEDEIPDHDTVNRMEYLDKVLNETLRMFPPVMQMGRHCKEECTIEGVHIPKNAVVATSILSLHYHPDLWKNPDVFDPERFSQEGKSSRHQYAHIPFSLGPRNCVGMRFALMEAKLAVIQVLRNYKLVSTSETQLKVNTKDRFVLTAEGGIKVKLVKRNVGDDEE